MESDKWSFGKYHLTITITGYTAGNTYVFRLSAKCSDLSTINDDVTVVVSPISLANAGLDVKQCPGTYSLNGNAPTSGETGKWTIEGGNGAGVSVSNVNSPNSSYTISGSSSGSTTLRWSFTNLANGCNSFDDVVITSPGGINPVTAGADQNLSKCYSSTQRTNLNGSYGGNGMDGQQGTWTVVSGPSVPTFSDSTNNSTNVSGLQEGTYVFRWTVSGPCANGFDEVTVTVPAPTADITKVNGNSQSFCDGSTSTLLVGTVPAFVNETVFWTQVSGPSLATIENPTSPSTNVLDLVGIGTYVFRYTISNSNTGCQSSGDYTIKFAETPTINAGNDEILSCEQTEVNIPITQTGDGETFWRIVNGPINPNFPSYPTDPKSFSGNTLLIEGLIAGGDYDVRVIKQVPAGNLCTTVTDDVKIVTSIQASESNGGTAQILDCAATTAVLAGNIPESGIGKWSQFSGPNQAVIADPFDASTEVSGMINGTYLFAWTITGGVSCISNQDFSRVIVSDAVPNVPDAGLDQTICFGTPIQLNATPPELNETGKWNVITGTNFTISDIEDPKAFFTGLDANTTYTLRWSLKNSCSTAYDEVSIITNNNQGPIGANAGPDVCLPSGTNVITLSGNDPTPGIGTWKQISGTAVTIDNPSLFNTTVSGVVDGNYEFEWSIESGGCSPSVDNSIVTVAGTTTVANAGPNQVVCSNTTTMAANTPLVGKGLWTLISVNPRIVIVDPSDPNTQITGLEPGSWIFAWTIINGACSTSTSLVQITVQEGPSTANAGPDQEVCGSNTAIFDANFPLNGVGTWSLISGPNRPTTPDLNANSGVVSGLITGTYVFRWTISTGFSCPDSFDDVTIVVRDIANAGNDIVTCDQGAVLLEGTIGTSGTWSFISGPGSPIITQVALSNSASVTNLSKGTSVFRYTIAAVGGCPDSTDDVSVVITGEPSTSNAGPDQVLCNNGTISLDGNVPVFGKGKWSILSGPTSGTFVPNDTAPNATYTNAPAGIYVFQWTISDAGCSNTDQVRVENNESPTNPDAGPDQNAVCGETTVLAANTPVFGVGNWTQISGPSTAVFSSVVLPNPTVSNLVVGDYVFEWSISNGAICPVERDQVNVKVFTAPTTPNAGPDQTVCASAPSVTLAANTIIIGSGKWTQVSGPSGTFSNDTSNSSLFTTNGVGVYTLQWTATNLSCSLSDQVVINVDAEPSTANAGLPISNCKFAALSLNANTPSVGTGIWSQISGPTPVVFVTPNDPKTQVLGVEVGVYVFEWTISNGVCPPSRSQVEVTITAEATLADAGVKQTICNTSTVTMAANNPVEGDGLWSFVINPGTAVITNPTSPTTTVTGITDGIFRLRWTITNACGSNFSEVNIEKLPDLITTSITPNQTICIGGTATFTSTASGGAASYSYQWQSSSDTINWNTISGQNTNQYTTPNNLVVGTYYYRIEVTNSCSTIYSNAATLVIVNDPVVTTQPIGNTICSGNTHTMNVVASGGTGTLLYQWQDSNDNSSFSDISGANVATYTTVGLNSNKYYRVKITQAASGCEVISNSVPVYVTTITTQPSTPAAICVGGTASLSVAASLNGGAGSLSYQWQSSPNGSNSWTDATVGTGITTTNYTTDTLNTTTWFRCKITSSTTSCELFSNTVTVTVVPDPSITVQPISGAICVGGNYTLSVAATNGTPSLTYQWQVSASSGSGFTDIAGATSNTYNTGNINTVETRYYRVIVSASGNGCNSITSSEATVTVVPDPIITDQPNNVTICDNTTTTLAVTATGDSSTGSLFYQWQNSSDGSSFSDIAGATNNTYTTPTLSSDTFYRVIITQSPSDCRVASTVAKVSVAKIRVQPTIPVDICVGGVVSVSVTTTVVPGTTYAYQWESSTNGTMWNDESNASATTANFTSDALNTTTQFRCVVTSTNPNCTLTSSAVTATVLPDPTIDSQPVGGTICIGGDFNLSVQASNGTPSLTYQWQSSTTSGTGFTDISGATNSNLSVTSLAQTTYYRVNISASGNGCTTITSSEAEVLVIPDPIIATQPVSNTTICKNSTASLSVVASGGSGTFSYQWQSAASLGGSYSNISGATSDTYTTSSLSVTSYFRVVVANSGSGCNTLTSTEATVFVGDISVQPVVPAPICSGGSATVSVTASANGGTATFTYQWESSTNGTSGWSSIGGATSNSYTTPALSSTTYYRCIVTSATPNCTLTSDVVQVDVVPDPTITTQPADGTICTGGSYDLSVSATNGTPSLNYQWQSSATLGGTYIDISGATSANYSTPALLSTTYYRVEVSASGDGCTTIISNPATVSVVADPIISTQPQDGAICVGNNYSFSVVASGNPSLGPLSYQWQAATNVSGPFTNVPSGTGDTTPNYTSPILNTTTTRYVRVAIKQGASGCETISNTVVLTISPQPAKPIGSVTQQPSCTNATGIITITAPAEGTGFEYSINGGASYQASSTFSGLTNGVKTITVRKIGATTCVSQGTDFTINNRICANPEVFASINGASGGTTTSVLGSDTLNGSPALLSTVNITVNSTSSSQLSLDTSNGLITIAPNTPAGSYSVTYTICEKANLSNCSSTTETVQVTQSVIDAVADVVVPSVNGFVGRPAAINALGNDKLNGVPALISQVTMTVVTPAVSIGGGPVPTLNAANGNVTVSAGTPEGTYTIEYQICEKLNPANCDITTILIPVVAPVIDAVNDSASAVNGANGNPNLMDVLSNDTLNGSAFALSQVNLTQLSGATPNTPGALVPVLNLANGIVSVPVGTPTGNYAINYQICEKLNPSNCDDAVATITVIAATLIANDDTLGPINGYVGDPNVVNVYFINDTFNGKVVDLSLVTPTILNTAIPVRPGAPVPVLDVATGIVSVPAGTPADDYAIQYQLCEKLNPTNCDVALINIRVLPPPIVATTDTSLPINGRTGSAAVLNAYTNDTLNGLPIILTEVTRTIVTPASSIGGGLVPILNTTTGVVSVSANTPAGTYTITYRLCENLNPSNCDPATITINVIASPIVANDDSVAGINGYVGQANALAILPNDTLSGLAVVSSDITIAVVSPASPIDGGSIPTLNPATGQVSIPAGTTAGNYAIVYSICEKLNPTNCDTATINITVDAPIIDAINDSVSNINGVIGQVNVLDAITNDTLNGVAAQLSEITINILVPALSQGGNVPVLSTTSGRVSVPAGTPAGTYTIVYEICEKRNPSNCDTASIKVGVGASTILATDDQAVNINGYLGANAVVNALTNDTVSGLPAQLSNVNLTIVTPATVIGAGAIPVLDVVTGLVNVPVGTSAGTYSILYQICEKLNPAVCDQATITIKVIAPVIVANDDAIVNINGYVGQANAMNAFTNDTLNGSPVKTAEIQASIISPANPINAGAVPFMDVTTGQVSIPAGTTAGNYFIDYRICETLNPSNCNDARITIEVIAPVIVANDDAINNINGAVGAVDVLDAIANDLLNGQPATLTQTVITIVNPATSIGGGLVPTLNPATGKVSVQAGTPSGTYTIEYQLCEQLNPTNCDQAIITIVVSQASIVANDDAVSNINGATGASNVLDVLANDTLNAQLATLAKVNLTVTQAATPISGGLVPILDINTAKVNVPAGTPAGNYIIKYRICEKLNPSNCDDANILVTVIAANIVANNDTVSNVNGYTGANAVINAVTNDLLNALPMKALDVKITQITPPVAINGGPVPTLNLITGAVNVPVKTPAGTYVIGYQVCEKLNPTNCDAAKITINVIVPVIDAMNDAVAGINGYVGATDILNVIQNDVLNGTNVIPSEITTTVVTPANSINAGAIPSLNTTTGYVSVPAGTTAGVYTIVYRICGTLNPSNCDTATATITVNPPVIEANDDLVDNINGLVGAADVINAITNDNLNGVPMQLTEVNITEITPATPIGGGLVPVLNTLTGTVSVPSGTPVGSYEIQYQVCEKRNPSNCDTAIITINVIAAKIIANDDSATNVDGFLGATNVLNALNNDKLNTNPIQLSEITMSVVDAALPIGGGQVPFLDTTTGQVSVPAGTTAGGYTIVYQICENLNASNCDTASIKITVGASTIIANNDSATGVNGYVGQANVVNAITNDTLAGLPVELSDITISVVIPAIPVNGGPVPSLDTATGQVSVPVGTPARTYSIVYRICENLNPTVCDIATIRVEVLAAPIVANNDTRLLPVNGIIGISNAINAYTNDRFNGASLILSELNVTVTNVPTPIPGANIPAFDTATGIVSVPAGTPAGLYSFTYQICEKLNPTNCDEALITVRVIAAPIDAIDDQASGINGFVGANNVVNVITNDKLNNSSVVLSDITLTVTQGAVSINGGQVPILNTATGQVSVPAGTASGLYAIEYQICEKLNPSNCDKAIAYITVNNPVIVANNDGVSGINGFVGATNALNVIVNDRLNGVTINLSQIAIKVTQGANSINGGQVPVLNTTTGQVSVPAGTAAGNYVINYQICEVLNPTNCDNAAILIAVVSPVIDAVNDTPGIVNGANNNPSIINVLTNDRLNNSVLTMSQINLTEMTPATPLFVGALVPTLDVSTGSIGVPAGTPQGAYTIEYQICEKLNPANCDRATVLIQVAAAPINAVDDFAGPINGYVGNLNVMNAFISNDTFNGATVTKALVVATIVNPASPRFPGANVPTLDTSTGIVSVPAGTPVGTYTIVYQLCERLNPTNCDNAIVRLQVTAAPIDAVDDTASGVNGYVGNPSVLNAFANDTFNAGALPLDKLQTTIIKPALSINGGPVPIFNTNTGNVSVPANTPSGNYTIVYQICEKLNPTNCDQATIFVNVIGTQIDAVDDSYQIVNGTEGATSILNVLSNDIFNGNPAMLSEVTLVGGTSGPLTIKPDGIVDVAPNTASGTYTINYSICSKLNPANCDSAKVTVLVQVPTITLIKKGVFVDANGDGIAQSGETIK